jgi:hypothetical protein
MQQYRITSADFISSGETGDPDAILSADDLNYVKQMAGLSFGTKLIQQQQQTPPITTPKTLREQKYE